MKKVISYFSLFTSMSTLLCCALPALLVSLGLGATLSTFLSQFPQVIWFSEQKLFVFAFAGISLTIAGYFQWRSQYEACPTDPQLREQCLWTRKWGLRIYLVSLTLFFIGFFFAFLITLF